MVLILWIVAVVWVAGATILVFALCAAAKRAPIASQEVSPEISPAPAHSVEPSNVMATASAKEAEPRPSEGSSPIGGKPGFMPA
jgi:hypothetical protein